MGGVLVTELADARTSYTLIESELATCRSVHSITAASSGTLKPTAQKDDKIGYPGYEPLRHDHRLRTEVANENY